MYLWKIDKLKEDLRQGSLSEKESFKYLLAWEILYSLPFLPSSVEGWNILDTYDGFVRLVVTIVGVLFMYKVNGGALGKYFLQRYLSIGWVVFVRFLALVMLPVLVVYAIVYGGMIASGAELSDQTTWVDILVFNLVAVVYYMVFAKHVKDVAVADTVTQDK